MIITKNMISARYPCRENAARREKKGTHCIYNSTAKSLSRWEHCRFSRVMKDITFRALRKFHENFMHTANFLSRRVCMYFFFRIDCTPFFERIKKSLNRRPLITVKKKCIEFLHHAWCTIITPLLSIITVTPINCLQNIRLIFSAKLFSFPYKTLWKMQPNTSWIPKAVNENWSRSFFHRFQVKNCHFSNKSCATPAYVCTYCLFVV